ncbi:MAG: AraC family transcriptional regulator ligand-binding domain-containing protein [Halieaceae bacterium]
MTRQAPMVHARGINAILQVAERFGVARDKLLARAHLEVEWLRHADDRLPLQRQFEMYRLAEELTGSGDIGLYVGRTLFFAGINLQLYMSTLCSSFREYLNLVPSILKLRGDIGEVCVERDGEFILLVWQPLQPESGTERYLSDEILVTSACIVNTLCIDPIPVRRADFTYSRPADLTQLQLAFGSELHFEQPRSCIYLDRASLKSPVIKLDYELDEDWASALEDLFEDELGEDPFLHDVRHRMVRALPQGEVSLDQLAKELGVSRRTLQRRLAERDTFFQRVLSEVRAELAARYLADKRLDITEIAFLLGYSDLASFSTAFRGWYKRSPSEYRAG